MSTLFHWPSANFWQRSITSFVFIALTALLIVSSHLPFCAWFFILGLVGVQSIALWEYLRLCQAKGFSPASKLLRWFSLWYLLVYALATLFPQFVHLPMFLLFLAAVSTPLAFLIHQHEAIANIALTIFGFVYIVLPCSLIIDINFLPRLPSGEATAFWLTWLLVTTKGSDMAAYFSGKLMGRHLLAASLSPKKTIEGAVGGLVGAAALSMVVPRYWPYDLPELPTSTWITLGCAIGVAAMIGDLSESLFKRDAGVKDSNSIPGLGGVLDIIDSILLTSPLLYVYLKVIGFLDFPS